MPQSNNPRRTALILGVSGQDGFFLSHRLLQLGFNVIGLSRQISQKVDDSLLRNQNFRGIEMDFTKNADLGPLLKELQPELVFNLAGFSHVGDSWLPRRESRIINSEFPKHLVAALTSYGRKGKPPRLFHASSSEIFGAASEQPQNENSPLNPVTPYGLDKTEAHMHILKATTAGEIDAVCGVLYNHESHLRPESFISRKMSVGAARIRLGLQGVIEVGSLSQKRDWGFAGDHVEAILTATLYGKSTHYVVGTGKLHSVGELVETAMKSAGLPSWRQFLSEQDSLIRDHEPSNLVADSSLAKRELGWYPKKTFEQTIKDMVDFDLARLAKEK